MTYIDYNIKAKAVVLLLQPKYDYCKDIQFNIYMYNIIYTNYVHTTSDMATCIDYIGEVSN